MSPIEPGVPHLPGCECSACYAKRRQHMLVVYRVGPIITTEWTNSEELLAALGAVALLVVGEPECAEKVRLAAAALATAVNEDERRRAAPKWRPGPSRRRK
jgi:hypothetical protein